jgi:enoyl-CoA hydratase
VEFESLIYQREGARAVLVMNRPKRRNALSPQLVDELTAALQACRDDDEVRLVVLTGAGERAFCAGGDLGAGMMARGVVPAHHGRARFGDLLRTVRDLGKPIVARVQGDALGGGFGLMLACDLVVASEEARFGTPEIKLGLFPYVIMATIFRNVGRKAGMEMVLTGDKIDAAKALELGLVNRVVPRDQLDAAVDELAGRVERHSPAILRLGRQAFHRMSEMSWDDSLDYLNAMLTLGTLAEDAMEGVTAFMEKRPPQWKGR